LQALSDDDLREHRVAWRVYEVEPGDRIEGTVMRLPQRGAFNGSRVFIADHTGDVLALSATAKIGHALLERGLTTNRVRVGDRISVTFHGIKPTRDGERHYRHYEVVPLDD
jgi:hypothetical protein